MYPDYDKKFILNINSSNLSFGAILAQLDDEGLDHPVAYTSCILKKHEKNHSFAEKEFLAVLHTVKQFQHYSYGTHFTMVTDHVLFKWLKQLKEPEGHIAR